MSQLRWMPLESNPDIMNQFLWRLGITPKFQFTDVFGFDPELLCMVPQPCLALIMLFPITEKYEQFRSNEAERLNISGQKLSERLFFMKQTIGNACGTIGVIHTVANLKERLEFIPNSTFQKFYESSTDLSPEEKGKLLENSAEISNLHKEFASEGQSAIINADQRVDLHFVALVQVDGNLYEFDGRKPLPINHGDSSPESFLEDASKVCKEFMKRDESELRFTVVALSEM